MKVHSYTSRLAALALGAAMALSGSTAALSDDKVSIAVNTMQIFSSLDPAKVTDYTGYMAIVNMYDGLTTVSPSGEIVPHLAKSWDISPDGLTYTFHLRDDAKFQNGAAVKASDLVWSIQRLIGINKGPSNLIVGLIKSPLPMMRRSWSSSTGSSRRSCRSLRCSWR